MRKLVTPFRVGLFVLAATAAFIGFYSFVHKGGLSRENSLEVYAVFHDAAGLENKTLVQIAGIPVGEVTGISLWQQEYARLTILIKKSVHVHTDAALTKRSASILGEYVLDLYPGSEAAPPMPEDGEIIHVYDEQGLQKIFESLGKVTDDVQAVTKSMRELITGNAGSIQNIVGNVADLTKSLNAVVATNGEALRDTLANFERLSAQLASLTSGERGNVAEIVDNIRLASGSAKDALATLNGILGSNKGQLAENFKGLKSTLEDLDQSIRNVQKITADIEQGHGTIGKLVTDDAMAEKIDKAVGGATDFVSRLTGMQTEVSLEDDYMFGEATSKGYLNLKLITKPDKYYLLQLVDDSRGTPSFSYVQNNPPGPLQAASQEVTTTSRSFKFSAEFAKTFFSESPLPTTVRLGMVESTAGGGVDLNMFQNHFGLTADLFDFDDYIQPYPRVRTYATLRLFDHLEVRGGFDDLLNCTNFSGPTWNCAVRNQVDPLSRGYTLGGREAFLGAGFYFTDDDLKAVLSVAPKP
ncbi:MAG TPA: MlaD family protein [Myxococcales bacterium]|nr:MlaD family protein [Myxococcales bacterium]